VEDIRTKGYVARLILEVVLELESLLDVRLKDTLLQVLWVIGVLIMEHYILMIFTQGNTKVYLKTVE
jgi:hypothetical protein